jgi:acetyl esterase
MADLKSVVLDPTIESFVGEIAAAGHPPVYSVTPEEGRETLRRAQSIRLDVPDVHIEDRAVDTAVGQVNLRVVRPAGAGTNTPGILYFHGGGWVLGDANTHDRLVRQLAAGSGATVVFVEYGRSPEHRYPFAINQAYEATRYVCDHADQLRIDPSRLAVAGDSAGGNMAAAVTLLAKQRSGPALRAQILFYPVANAAFDTSSYQEFANGPWLTRAAMQWFWDQYLPNEEKRKEPYASPLLASRGELAGLPRALVITAENDVLRDEGEAYGRKLMQAGVPTVVTRYIGAIHDFMMLNRIAAAAPVRAAVAQAVQFLSAVLAP